MKIPFWEIGLCTFSCVLKMNLMCRTTIHHIGHWSAMWIYLTLVTVMGMHLMMGDLGLIYIFQSTQGLGMITLFIWLRLFMKILWILIFFQKIQNFLNFMSIYGISVKSALKWELSSEALAQWFLRSRDSLHTSVLKCKASFPPLKPVVQQTKIYSGKEGIFRIHCFFFFKFMEPHLHSPICSKEADFYEYLCKIFIADS